MLGAELVDLVMDLVVDPDVIVVDGVVPDGVHNHRPIELINDLDSVKVDHDTTGGPAGDVRHRIGLQSHLNLLIGRQERVPDIVARLGGAREQLPSTEVDSDVALLDDVDPEENGVEDEAA